MRTQIISRSDKLTGPYESKVALKYKGIAQGGLIDTPSGEWYAFFSGLWRRWLHTLSCTSEMGGWLACFGH